ncbi:MAG: metallophosphoesterase [Bacteroidales bacterium]|nr:metallophosphoesterase [Bacteroidales bacterium]
MKTKLFLIYILLLGANYSFSQPIAPKLRVGLVTDVQYCDCNSEGKREYRKSLDRLDQCITEFNSAKVNFSFHLGDLIDRNIDNNLGPVLKEFSRSDSTIYHVLGNHDVKGVYSKGFRGKKGDKAFNKLMEYLSMPTTYYSEKRANVVFIVLNTNDLAQYSIDAANKKRKGKEDEYLKMVERTKQYSDKNSLDYNGGISEKQLEWLKETLADAQKNHDIVILFSHQPLFPENGMQVLNNREVLNVIDKFDCVKAMFAGHHHAGGFAYYKNIPVVTLEGMVEVNAYAILDIYSNKLVLNGFGKVESREFDFKEKQK